MRSVEFVVGLPQFVQYTLFILLLHLMALHYHYERAAVEFLLFFVVVVVGASIEQSTVVC